MFRSWNMKTRKVKDLMLPISAHETIALEATLYEAALTLKEAQREFDQEHDRYRGLCWFEKIAMW
jgi:hypothetical protein